VPIQLDQTDIRHGVRHQMDNKEYSEFVILIKACLDGQDRLLRQCFDNYFVNTISSEQLDNAMGLTKLKICECGREKHGFASHSQWCGMFNG
jgi:hypothetical protein